MPSGNSFPNSTFGYGVGRHIFTGNVVFVDSGHANAAANNIGKRNKPFSSIENAINNGGLAANNDDAIFAMPGHVETITAAAGLDIDIAGLSIIGLGHGAARPQINFTTAVGADMDVDAASLYMENFLFTGGIDALTGPIDINAADCKFVNIETRDVTGQTTDFIVTDANADRLAISGWVHRGAAAAGADTAITIVGGDNITIEDFWIDGNFAVACIENVTTASVNLTVGGGTKMNYARTRNAADVIFTGVATTTGNVGPNIFARIVDDTTNITEAFVGADMQFFQPIAIVNADGEVGLNTNIAASADA